MAFPTTGVLDDYNRVGPGLGANWTTDARGFGDASMQISGNTVTGNGTTAVCTNFYNVANYGADSECFADITALLTSGQNAGLFARLVNPGTASSDGYQIDWLYSSGGTDTIALQRMDNGVFTQLGASISQDFAVGDSIGIGCAGSTITAYRKPSGGAWGAIGTTRTDSTYSTAGKLGTYFESAIGSFDNLGGGTTVADIVPILKHPYSTLVRM